MYIHAPTNTYPYSDAQLRRDNPGTSFPAVLTDETRAAFGMMSVVAMPQPTYDPLTERVTEGTPAEIDGAWTQVWNVVALTAEEIAAAQKALQDSIVADTQDRLDTFAQTRGYDGILSACTYATSPTPKFAAEGQYCVVARDNTWATLYQILADVEAGNRPMPGGFEDIEPDLPVLAWPN